ncbi:hypothetical protein [Rhizobium phage RHEph12]|nr:hypothetical protein [Rhizobium phage RHEph12]
MSQAKLNVDRYPNVEAAAAAGDFYAMNASDLNGKRARGKVIIGFSTRDGSEVKILFPPSWIPLDLSEYAPLDDLKNATNIREYVRKGLIILITKKSYDALTQHPNYAKERARVNELNASFIGSTASGSATISHAVNVDSSKSIVENQDGMKPLSTPQTSRLLEALGDDEAISLLDQCVGGLSFGEIRTLTNEAAPGTFLQLAAFELDAYMVAGKQLPQKVAEMQAFKDYQQKNGAGSEGGPNISFN